MEEENANTPESTSKNTSTQLQQNDKDQYEIAWGNLKLKGPERFISTLIVGLLSGVLIFYLAVFQMKKPPIFYRVLVEEPFFQTQTAAPSATPQIVEIIRKETRIVPTVYVTKETVLVPAITITKETVVIKETVSVLVTVVVTPTPTHTPEPNKILERDLNYAFECGAIVLRNLGGIDFQGWSNKDMTERILLQWVKPNAKCRQIWVGFAQERMTNELITILKSFRKVNTIEWIVDIPSGSSSKTEDNRYSLIIPTELQMSGQYQCSSTPQMISIVGDEDPLTFEGEMSVELQELYDRIVIRKWKPRASALDLLDQNCQ